MAVPYEGPDDGEQGFWYGADGQLVAYPGGEFDVFDTLDVRERIRLTYADIARWKRERLARELPA